MRALRGGLAVLAVVTAALSVGYFLQIPLATATWPFVVTPITYQFLGAYVLGSAAVMAWIAATGELAGLTGLGLTSLVAYGTFALALLLGTGQSVGGLPLFNVLVTVVLAVAGAAALVFGVRQQPRDARMTPAWVRVTSGVAVAGLLGLGVPMVLRVPEVLPWRVDLDSAVLIGCFFIGSASFFALAALRREWANSAGQWAALLVYDAVLAVPLLLHFPVAQPQHIQVLIGYIAFVLTTLVIGLYLFFIDRRFRWGTTG